MHAAQCLALARIAADPGHKRLFVEMASSWHDLAVLLAAYSDEALVLLSPVGGGTRPDEPLAIGGE
jgi:hypothetical protein